MFGQRGSHYRFEKFETGVEASSWRWLENNSLCLLALLGLSTLKNVEETPGHSIFLNPPSTIRAVLCYIRRQQDEKYLLLHKAKGKFGEGFWNAPGGKIHPKESPRIAAIREVQEETGLTVSRLQEVGSLAFFFGEHKTRPDWTAKVFVTSCFEGRIKRSEEGILRWFPKDELPLQRMWADDKYWLPLLTNRISFQGNFTFSSDSKKLLTHNVVRLGKFKM